LRSMRGVGMCIRLLQQSNLTIESLNLHPTLRSLSELDNGLIVISGPTGSGKSSTLAALVNEINHRECRHIITLESPIEYLFKPCQSYIRQREIGRDSPSFSQALLDSLREDPDVLAVGEMRDPETIRLTLTAAETGHLVLATLHSGNTSDALERMVGSFAPEVQYAVAAQLADCLKAVVVQRLTYHEKLQRLIPECEILRPTPAAKSHIRNREFFKIITCLETGAETECWTFQRYREWIKGKQEWASPHKLGMTADAPDHTADKLQQPRIVRSREDLGKDLSIPSTDQAERVSKAGSHKRIEIEPFKGELQGLLKPKDPGKG
jgi:twitching motility protein PilT